MILLCVTSKKQFKDTTKYKKKKIEGNQKIKDTNQKESGCGYIEVDFKVKRSGGTSDNDQTINVSKKAPFQMLTDPSKEF